jgi:hypothetical protein
MGRCKPRGEPPGLRRVIRLNRSADEGVRKSRRRRGIAAVALAVGASIIPLAPRADAACASVTVEGEWSSIAAPAFPEGPQEIAAFSIVPAAPDSMYATNGRVVMRSDDGGCSWRDVFRLTMLPDLDVPVSALAARIVRIEVPENRPTHVILLAAEDVGRVVRPHVLVSSDAGGTWTSGDAGLPQATGGNLRLHGAPSNPDVAYLSVRSSPASNDVTLFRSANAGRSWQTRSSSPFAVSDFRIDPVNADELWLYGASGVARSTNGGAGIVPTAIEGATPLATVVHPRNGKAVFMGYDPDGGTMVITSDGVTVQRIGAPPNFVLSMADSGELGGVVASVHQGFARFVPPRYWIDIARADQHERPDILDIMVDRTATPSVFGRTAVTIERYRGLSTEIDVGSFDLGRPELRRAVPSLTPADGKVRIRAGATKSVPYRLNVPAEGVGLDVFFLVDTTQSMQSSINGLRTGMQRVADELAASGIDVQFGVGEYKDYSIPGYGRPQEGDFAYRLLQKVGPVGPGLERALEALVAGGGGDPPESGLTALYQAATGEGEPPYVSPAGVPQGSDAGFRPGALKVMINISDAPFHNSPAHPSPPFDTVAAALGERGIKQVGLAVYGPNGVVGAMSSLTAMAAETGTIAPAGGVDCTGDGRADLGSGEPLVCRIDDEASRGVLNLAPAIIATLKSLRRDVPVRLDARQGASVVENVDASARRVNVLAPDVVRFDVSFTCPEALSRSTEVVELGGVVREETIATARAEIECLPLRPDARRAAVDPLDLPPLPAIAPVAPAAAIVLVPPAPPGPLVEHLPTAQNNPAAQTGLASQEEEQLQVAVAQQRLRHEAGEELAFSALPARRSDPVPAPAFVGGAGAILMAAAWAALGRAESRVAAARAGAGRHAGPRPRPARRAR